MNNLEKIENRCIDSRETFCEFLACLYNKGLCEISSDFKDSSHFYFHRENNAFGINDLYIFSEDSDYIDSVLSLCNGLLMVIIISPGNLNMKKYEHEWKVGVRRQFYKNSIASNIPFFDAPTKLNGSHFSIINSSSSETVKNNYNMSLEFGVACYAIIENGLKCFLSTCSNQKIDALEINWIFTEPEYRNKGYASDLLRKVSDYYVSEGYTITYHCSDSNMSSANTALKAGFTETVNEIILDRK